MADKNRITPARKEILLKLSEGILIDRNPGWAGRIPKSAHLMDEAHTPITEANYQWLLNNNFLTNTKDPKGFRASHIIFRLTTTGQIYFVEQLKGDQP